MSSTSRLPPAVQYPVRRSRALGLLLSAVLLVGTAVLAGWFFFGVRAAFRWPVWAAGGFLLIAAGGALHFWLAQLVGVLRWDGHTWTLEVPGAHVASMPLPEAPEVLVDVQSHLWLHAVVVGRGRIWLGLERSAGPERWLDLRRAVYSRAIPGVDNNDATAAVTHRGRES